MENLNVILAAFALGMSIIGSIWAFALWIHKSFSGVQDKLYSKLERLEKVFSDKLEYHERHDDKRFSEVHDEIWELKLRHAASQGYVPVKKKILETPTN